MALSRNVVASAGMALWLLALRVVSTREMIRGLGVEGYGVLVLVSSVTTLLGFASGGLASAVMRHVSHDMAAGDRDSARRIVGSSLMVSAGAGIVLIFVLSLFSEAIIGRLLYVTGTLATAAAKVVLLTGVTLGVGLVTGIYYSVLVALRRYGALVTAQLVTLTLLAVAQVALVRLGTGLVWLAAASLAFGVLDLVLLVICVTRAERTLAFPLVAGKVALKKLLSFGAIRTVEMAATVSLMHIDRMIIGLQFGAAGIAYYSIPQALALQLSHVAGSLTEPLLPRLSEMVAMRDREGVRRLYHRSTRLLVWLVVTAVACGMVLSDALFHYWLGATFAAHAAPIMRWLLVGWGLMALSLVGVSALNAFGLPGVNAQLRVVQGALLFVACLVLVPRIGTVGAAYALAGSMLLTVPPQLAYVDRKLDLRCARVVGDLYLKPVAIGAVLVAVGLLLNLVEGGLIYGAGLVVFMPMLSVVLALVLGTIKREEGALALTALGEAWGRIRSTWGRPAVAGSTQQP